MPLFDTLTNIAQGWFNYIEGSPETKQRMYKRLQICDGCEFKVEMDAFGKALVQSINSKSSTFKCGKCNCPLSAAAASPHKKCDMGLWPVEVVEAH